MSAKLIAIRTGRQAGAPFRPWNKNRYGHVPEDFPTAVLAEDTTITLPIFPG